MFRAAHPFLPGGIGVRGPQCGGGRRLLRESASVSSSSAGESQAAPHGVPAEQPLAGQPREPPARWARLWLQQPAEPGDPQPPSPERGRLLLGGFPSSSAAARLRHPLVGADLVAASAADAAASGLQRRRRADQRDAAPEPGIRDQLLPGDPVIDQPRFLPELLAGVSSQSLRRALQQPFLGRRPPAAAADEFTSAAAAATAEPEIPCEPPAPAPTPGGGRRRRLPATEKLLQPPPGTGRRRREGRAPAAGRRGAWASRLRKGVRGGTGQGGAPRRGGGRRHARGTFRSPRFTSRGSRAVSLSPLTTPRWGDNQMRLRRRRQGGAGPGRCRRAALGRLKAAGGRREGTCAPRPVWGQTRRRPLGSGREAVGSGPPHAPPLLPARSRWQVASRPFWQRLLGCERPSTVRCRLPRAVISFRDDGRGFPLVKLSKCPFACQKGVSPLKYPPCPPSVARSDRGVPGTMSLTAPAGASSLGIPFPSFRPAVAPRPVLDWVGTGHRKQIQVGELSALLPFQGFCPK